MLFAAHGGKACQRHFGQHVVFGEDFVPQPQPHALLGGAAHERAHFQGAFSFQVVQHLLQRRGVARVHAAAASGMLRLRRVALIGAAPEHQGDDTSGQHNGQRQKKRCDGMGHEENSRILLSAAAA